jgi:hypothetical protein
MIGTPNTSTKEKYPRPHFSQRGTKARQHKMYIDAVTNPESRNESISGIASARADTSQNRTGAMTKVSTRNIPHALSALLAI